MQESYKRLQTKIARSILTQFNTKVEAVTFRVLPLRGGEVAVPGVHIAPSLEAFARDLAGNAIQPLVPDEVPDDFEATGLIDEDALAQLKKDISDVIARSMFNIDQSREDAIATTAARLVELFGRRVTAMAIDFNMAASVASWFGNMPGSSLHAACMAFDDACFSLGYLCSVDRDESTNDDKEGAK
jgi:hypothetical protein